MLKLRGTAVTGRIRRRAPAGYRTNVLNNSKFRTGAGDGRTWRTMPAKHSLIANEDIVEQLELNETE